MVEPTQTQLGPDGQPLPQQGAAPGVPASPAALLSGAPDLATAVASAYMAHLAKNQPPPTVAVQQQAADAAMKTAPVDTTKKPAPGSFSDKLQGATNAFGDAMSDASHASDTKGGWLTGVANTLNARSQRIAQDRRDQTLIAKTQAETIMMHRNVYLQDEKIRQGMYTANQQYVDTMQVNHELQSDIQQDQLSQMMQKDKNFAATHYVRATSETPVLGADGQPKIDKNGLPVMKPLYTVVTRATKDGQPDDHAVTADMSADAKRLIGSTLPTGTKLTTDQFTALQGQIGLARNTVNILDSTNGKPLTDDQMKTLSPYLNDPQIQHAISSVPGSAYAGLMKAQQNADDHITALNDQAETAKANKDQAGYDAAQSQIQEIKQEKGKITQFASQAISPAQVAAYDKKADENITLAKKALTDGSVLTGDKASGVLAQLEGNLATATDPKQRTEIQRAISVAKVARDNYFEDLKRKANADQFAKQGDPIAAGRALANHDLTLADLRTRQTTSEFILQATEAAKALTGGKYNPADEIAYEKVASSPRNETLFGSSRSIIEAGGTADRIVALGQQLPDTGFPRLNSYEDWLKTEADHGAFSGYASMALGLADDYGKVMGGGAASDRARDHALSLLSQAHTQDARVAAVREIVNATMSQRKGTIGNNSFTERQYNNFDKSPLATEWTAQNAADVAAANAHQLAQANGGNTSGTQQQPKQVTSSNGLQSFQDDVSKRPKDKQGRPATQVKTGSDQKLYYFGEGGEYLGPVPAQYQNQK